MAGSLEEARNHFEEYQGVAVPLARSDPNDDQYAQLEAASHQRIAEVDTREDDTDAALGHLQKARRIYQTIASKDPNNLRRQRDAARIVQPAQERHAVASVEIGDLQLPVVLVSPEDAGGGAGLRRLGPPKGRAAEERGE